MSDYKRFVSYLYEYIAEKKSENRGYVKVELRSGICRMQFQLNVFSLSERASVSVYGFLFPGSALSPSTFYIGELRPGRSGVSGSFTFPARIAGTAFSVSDFNGLVLTGPEGKFYGTQWDETPIVPASFVFAPQTDGSGSSGATPPAGGIPSGTDVPGPGSSPKEGPASSGSPSDAPSRGTPDPSGREPNTDRQSHSAPSSGSSSEAGINTGGSPSGVPSHSTPDPSLREPNAARQSHGAPSSGSSSEARINTSGSPSGAPSRGTPGPSGRGLNTDSRSPGAVPKTSGGPTAVERVPSPKAVNPPLSARQMRPAAGTQRTAAAGPRVASPGGCRRVPAAQTPCSPPSPDPSPAPKAPEGSEAPTVSPASGLQMTEGAGTSKEGHRVTAGAAPAGPGTCTAGGAPHMDGGSAANSPNDELHIASAEPARRPTPWESIRRSYPPIQPFDDGLFSECVKITPQDLPALRNLGLAVGCNQFMIHGFQNHRHLLLGRYGVQGRSGYVLGVPGLYTLNEQFMASMFGFSGFRPAPLPESYGAPGKTGYWYRLLN